MRRVAVTVWGLVAVVTFAGAVGHEAWSLLAGDSDPRAELAGWAFILHNRAGAGQLVIRRPGQPLLTTLDYKAISLCCWIFLAVWGALALTWWVGREARRTRRADWQQRGHCGDCGYDLTANASGTCPECGARAAAPAPP